MVRVEVAAPVLSDGDDPVLDALTRAPTYDFPESEEERLAVEAAKASRRMRPHAAIELMLEDRR